MRSWRHRPTKGLVGCARAGGMVIGGLLAVGCAANPLPVRRVVIYRNGVAYFERGGRVTLGQVRFKMKSTTVADFLATLAVTEHGQGPIRAASFPVRAVGMDAQSDDPSERGNAKETIVLSLDGQAHDLEIGYVAESPVWKPSYRLVLHHGGNANLQIWGIVENFSGEDWKDVRLSLMAGAPIAYTSDLNTPVIPSRPTVSDRGEPPMAVPRSEGPYGYLSDALAQRNQLDQSVMVNSSASASADSGAAAIDKEAAAKRRHLGMMSSAARPPVAGSSLLGAVAVERGTTRYDLPLPVTIADGSASMVMAVDRSVTGEVVVLFAPDGAVPESSSHPFRAVRFENGTGGSLEPGPVAMFEEGTFLGQAVTEKLPSGATATVPFALERSITVTHEVRTDDMFGRLTATESGTPTLERSRRTRTVYRVRNDTDQATTVLVKHARAPQSQLFAAPPGTLENVSLGSALVPSAVATQANAEVVVDERVPVSGPVDWFAPAADSAVKAFLADVKSDAATVQKMAAAWAIRNEIVKLNDERSSQRMQAYDLKGDPQHRAPEAAAKAAAIDRRIAELEAKIGTLTVKFEEALRGITMR